MPVSYTHLDVYKRQPNDISGVIYENMDSSGAWKLSIAKELKAAGYQIDFNNII